jgi:hypothetical protein
VSSGIQNLRPVTFHYKVDPDTIHYGLIAEEVAQTFPALAVRGQNGQVDTVAYHELPVLLLNELQKEARIVEQQKAELEAQGKAMDAQSREMEELKARLAALEAAIKEALSQTK